MKGDLFFLQVVAGVTMVMPDVQETDKFWDAIVTASALKQAFDDTPSKRNPFCEKRVKKLEKELYADPATASITVVVRLKLNRRVVGWKIIKGHYTTSLDEAKAREIAQKTGLKAIGKTLTFPTPEDEYIFWESPLVPRTESGSVTVVSTRNGKALFGATITLGGKAGKIVYPKKWRKTDILRHGCDAPNHTRQVPVRGYDLSTGDILPVEVVKNVYASIEQGTIVPKAIREGGYLLDVVVLLYPRIVNPLDRPTAEWIVLLNARWLE